MKNTFSTKAKRSEQTFSRIARTVAILLAIELGVAASVHGETTAFFNAAQTATVTSSNINAITINSEGYLFTYSVDGYWSPYPGGDPTGRFFTVLWPNGVQAQAVTAGPKLGTGANITIKRADGKPFDLQSFTGKILLNTAGAGAAFEIMPMTNGNDTLPDPLQYDCSGYAGQSFSYTPALTAADTYQIHMWGDFALTALTLNANIITNTPPLAFGGHFYQLTNTPLAINIADMMINDYDPDGDAVVFTAVSNTTSNGLPIGANATQVLIPANSVADSFTYTITDNNGGNATGTVTISIITNPAGEPVSLDLTSTPGFAIANFSGVPWYSYTVERATNATFTGWIQMWPMQAWSDGSISLWDNFTDIGGAPNQAFYRLSFP